MSILNSEIILGLNLSLEAPWNHQGVYEDSWGSSKEGIISSYLVNSIQGIIYHRESSYLESIHGERSSWHDQVVNFELKLLSSSIWNQKGVWYGEHIINNATFIVLPNENKIT